MPKQIEMQRLTWRGGRENDWSDDWMQPQRQQEGRCWADMKATTADNTYTGKGGTKRD